MHLTSVLSSHAPRTCRLRATVPFASRSHVRASPILKLQKAAKKAKAAKKTKHAKQAKQAERATRRTR